MIVHRIFPLLIAALCLAGCNKITDADKAAAVEAVKKNVEAMQERNLAGVAETIHSQSPHFEQTKMITDQLFKRYDLQYTLRDVSVESVSGDTIRVHFDQEVVRTSGPADFKDNRTSGVHVLRREDGAWKLWSTENQHVTYLASPAK